jgi:hypothetical protein
VTAILCLCLRFILRSCQDPAQQFQNLFISRRIWTSGFCFLCNTFIIRFLRQHSH